MRRYLMAICLVFIIGILAIALPGTSPSDGAAAENPAASAPGLFNVRDYGARGDGVADDYDALQRVAAAVSAARGGTVYFPPGRYRINRHRVTGGPARNNVGNITYSNCDGLTLMGYGAVIEVEGRFHRSADTVVEKNGAPTEYRQSHLRSVTPFVFNRCRNFRMLGFEIDGNVDEMTRDAPVAETFAHGIVTQECSDYLLQGIYVHHFQSDGVYLGNSNRLADRGARLVGVRSAMNARQGLSIIQLRGGVFTDCVFEDTGRARGTYGKHAPGAGVDVEPNHRQPQVDVNTGDLVFRGCTFVGNAGSQFQCGMGDMVEQVRLEGCTIIGSEARTAVAVIMAVNGGELRDCRLLEADVEASRSGRKRVTTTIRTSVFTGTSAPIRVPAPGDVTVEDNQIIQTRDSSQAPYAALLANPGVRFQRNTVWFPDSAPGRQEAGADAAALHKRIESSGNRIITGPPPPGPAHTHSERRPLVLQPQMGKHPPGGSVR